MRRQAQASIAAHRLTPGSSPRSPIVGRVKAPVVTEDALVEHLSVDVGFPPAVAQLYADALRAGGYGSVAALANLSLDTLRTELGFKLGHIKRIQQHREELLARTLRDSPEPPQSPPRSPQSTPQSPRSPRFDDSVLEQYMFATHSREQQVEKELMTLREDLGTVLGELAALKASHAELKRRQQQPQPPPQQQQPEPEPEPEPRPRGAVPDAVAALGTTARDGIGDAPRGAAVDVDMQRLEEAWLDVDEQRCESQLLLQATEIFSFQEFCFQFKTQLLLFTKTSSGPTRAKRSVLSVASAGSEALERMLSWRCCRSSAWCGAHALAKPSSRLRMQKDLLTHAR
jgi:hypothetical protein